MSLVIGAAGAVGKRLIGALAARGENVIAAMRSTPLPDHLQTCVQRQVMNVDQGNIAAIRKIFKRNPEIHTVYNISVVRSSVACKEATVNGMANVLEVMREYNCNKMIFADSVASFGAAAPRQSCSARWLTENRKEDPQSEIGTQKQQCRELLSQFNADGADARFAVIPALLHVEAVWGSGLTSYPLDACFAAVEGLPYVCPIEEDVSIPMIYVDDLIRGLLDLSDAPQNMLYEPDKGYVIPGFSCTPKELFAEIRRTIPEFATAEQIDDELNSLARTWPDSLSTVEASRDLGYRPAFRLDQTIQRILRAQTARRQPRAVSAEQSSIGVPQLGIF